jgi:hypothetical protein
MEIDRRLFIASLGGAAAVASMDPEAKADALEDYMTEELGASADDDKAAPKFPSVADIEAQIETRPFRRGAGGLFVSGRGNVKKLDAMPANPNLVDFFKLRFGGVVTHCLQSANHAQKTGMSEEIVFACLLHDVVQSLIKTDHGWWGAQLFEPYVSEKVTFAIRYHAALRFYPDSAAAGLYRNDVQDGAQPQVVHGTEDGDGERSVRVRSERESDARPVHRHYRAQFQAAQRRLGQ